MLVGHTKFAPDWCFGFLKQRLWKTRDNCLADLKRVVEESAKANLVQLAGDQSGNPLVPVYDWATHLGTFCRKVPNIKSYHHFRHSSSRPGVVMVKMYLFDKIRP